MRWKMFKVTVQSVESKCLHAVQYVSAETCSIIDLKCLCSRVEGVTWIPGWCLYRGAAQFSGVWLSGVEAVTQSGSHYKIIHRYTTSCWLFIHIRSSSVTDSSQSGSCWIQSLSWELCVSSWNTTWIGCQSIAGHNEHT